MQGLHGKLLVTSLLLLAGCGGGTGRSEAASLPTFPMPSGVWSGLASCAGRDFPIELSFDAAASGEGEAGTADLRFAPAVNSTGYRAPNGFSEQAAFAAEPLLHAGVLQLRAMAAGRRAKSLTLLLTPDGEAAALRADGCDAAVLAPADGSHPIQRLGAELEALQARPTITEADQAGACPAALEAWIDKGLALPLDDWGRGDSSALWSDETGQQIFGKPFSAMRVEERFEHYRALAGRCGERGDRRRNGVIRVLTGLIDYRGFRDAQLQAMAADVVRGWQAGFEALVAADGSGRQLPVADAQTLQSIPLDFRFEALLAEDGFDATAYLERASTLSRGARARQRNDDFLSRMERASDDFVALLAHYDLALQDPDLDVDAATALVEDRLPAAAERYSAAAATIDEAQVMADWLADWPSRDACDAVLEGACRSTETRFETRLRELARSWSETEAETLAKLEQEAPSTALLARAIEARAVLDGRYGSILARSAFEDLLEDYADWISDLQDDLERPLLEAVAAARTAPELRSLQARYFRPGDLERRPVRAVRDALDERLEASRPFRSTGADAYLNALYNRDFPALRQLDAQVLASVRPAFGFMATQIAMLGSLADAAAGIDPFRAIVAELSSPSALRPVAMTYLLEFERRYPECLGSNAVTITVTERTDLVERTAGGVEISRIEGVTNATHYRVKPALVDLFRDSFSRPSAAGADRLFTLLTGDESVSRLRAGVREGMGAFDCDSAEIRQFEAGLVAYQRELKRRWSR
ncbi:MAG: hypothetical protein V2I63_01230 [Pseudomonadales bacterium]|jgi:hypothetical protein|nr:hypothetical protein [Pseudomonadales bacterium]